MDEEPTEEPSAVEGDGLDRLWSFYSETGTAGTFSVPSKPNALVERVEAIRKEVKGKEKLTYVVVSVDNTDGTEPANMYSLVFVTQDGEQIESIDLDEVLSGWRDVNDTKQYNRIIDLQNDLQVYLRPGSKGTAVMAFDQPIPSIARAFVYPSGVSLEVEAFSER